MMPASTSPRKAHRPRRIHVPMMASTHTEFALQLHASLAMLYIEPDSAAWETIGAMFNIVQVAIQNRPKFRDEARIINSGAVAMQDIERKLATDCGLLKTELAPIRNAVNAVDLILPKIDIMTLHRAIGEVMAMRDREEAAA